MLVGQSQAIVGSLLMSPAAQGSTPNSPLPARDKPTLESHCSSRRKTRLKISR